MRILKNKIFIVSMIFFFIEIMFIWIAFCSLVPPKIIALCFTAILATFGYFVTHYLEISRKEREKKLELYLQLAKSLRFFLREPLNTKEDDKILLDNFQNSYFESALFVSKKTHNQIVKFIRTCKKNYEKQNEETKDLCDEELSNLINVLRNEFFPSEKIDLEFFKFGYKK